LHDNKKIAERQVEPRLILRLGDRDRSNASGNAGINDSYN
jgi:hypothetical protein